MPRARKIADVATTRRAVERLARRAGGRPISRHARADLTDALHDLAHLVTDTTDGAHPSEQVDAFLADLETLASDVEAIVTRGRSLRSGLV